MEIIELKHIKLNVKANDWKQAIKEVGQLLIDDGYIQNGYIDEMIDAVIKLGPYIVLMPGFALAHSAISDSVMKTGISLITLKEPVNFGSDNDPVKVVMCLACVDKESHIEKLQVIANKLSIDNAIEKIINVSSEKEIYDFFNK